MYRVHAVVSAPALAAAACGQNTDGPCDTGGGPSEAADAASTQALAGVSPSCLAGGPSVSDCGSATESCTSLPVAGGTFYRTYANSNCSPTAEADPASVSSFPSRQVRCDCRAVSTIRERLERGLEASRWLGQAYALERRQRAREYLHERLRAWLEQRCKRNRHRIAVRLLRCAHDCKPHVLLRGEPHHRRPRSPPSPRPRSRSIRFHRHPRSRQVTTYCMRAQSRTRSLQVPTNASKHRRTVAKREQRAANPNGGANGSTRPCSPAAMLQQQEPGLRRRATGGTSLES